MATTSPLRQRMIEDMTIHNLSQTTQLSYSNAIARSLSNRAHPPRPGTIRLVYATALKRCLSGHCTSYVSFVRLAA